MICIADRCQNQIWAQGRAATETAATEKGWRYFGDAKMPALYVGAALCPKHTDEAENFQPAPKQPRRTS